MKTIAFLYCFIALCTTIYGAFIGDQSYKAFSWHLGQGLVWPAVLFPSFGKTLGILIFGVLALGLFFSKK